MHILSPSQCRAARALLGWSQPDLAEASKLNVQTICAFEKEIGSPSKTTLQKILSAFSGYVDFIDDIGVQHKSPKIKIYKGRNEFIEFMKSVYETVKDCGGKICVANVDERTFEKWLGEEEDTAHMKRMESVKNLNFRVLLKEGDDYFSSPYCEYKWTHKERYDEVPLYLYGNKTALIVFGELPTVYVLSAPEITAMFHHQFEMLWSAAKTPPQYSS